MKIDVTINAGQTLEYYEPGDFFRLLDATAPVSITFYKQGKEVSEAENVGEGFAEKFRVGDFDRIRIYSATSQSLSFVIRLGADVYYDKPPTGEVKVVSAGAVTQTGFTLTTADQTVLAANPARRYLLIQNRSLTNGVQVNLTGGAVLSQPNVLAIEAGGSAEFVAFCPSGEIKMCAGAGTAQVTVVEG